MIDELKARPVSHSKTILSELMVPAYTNFGGKIHGGIILNMMDKVAYVCATKHAGNYCVTASIDSVDFVSAVDVGSQLSLYASVNYVGKSSLIIGIKVVSEDIKLGIVKHTNTSYFTMVAMDSEHQPTKVPPLILETKEDIRRFLETKKRKELKQKNKSEYVALKLNKDFECDVEKLLATENCLINMNK